MGKISEVDVAKHVVNWFKINNYDVYEEVSFGYGHALDFAAVRKPVIAAIEVKTSLSLAVIGQAKNWIDKANLVYIAIPNRKRNSSDEGAKWICNLLGLGLLYVSKSGNVQQVVHPTFRRVDTKLLFSKLIDKQKDGSIPAGTATGSRWTPFKVSISNLVEFVTKHPGLPLKEVLTKTKHHWASDSSARACIVKYINDDVIKELRFEGKDKKLYPK